MSATDQSPAEQFLAAFYDEVADRLAERLHTQQADPNRLLTMAQVGERLGVGERAARNLTYSHHGQPPELATIRVGSGGGVIRVEEKALLDFIEARRVAGKGTRRA